MKVELTPATVRHLEHIIDYMWHDKMRHYMGEKDHIFLHVKAIAKFLTKTGASDYSLDLADAAQIERDLREEMKAAA